MNVGDVRVINLSQTAASGLTIGAERASAVYAVILANTAVNTGGAIRSYTVSGDWLAPATPSVRGDFLSPQAAASRLVAPRMPTMRGDVRLRELEREQLRIPPRPGPGSPLVSRSSAPPAPRRDVPTVGALLQIKVLTPPAFNGQDPLCSTSSYTTTTGKVMAVGQYSVVVSDVNSPSGGFTATDFQNIASEFDSLIYPTDVSYFGNPTDIDGNGRVIIYYTPAVNRMTAPGDATTSGYVGGFFFAGDMYPPTAPPNGCYSSNQGEIFYLLAPDPGAIYGNTFDASFVREVTRGTVAHEFQHMINSGNRYVKTSSAYEATWLDEALAHLAEDVVGRAKAGFGDQQTVDYTALKSQPSDVQSAFFLQNLARAKYYVEAPDTTSAIVTETKASANLASRGAGWALLRYTADWFSGSDPRIITRKLVAGPDTGTVNLPKAAGAPMDTLLAHWLVTLYTDHRGIPGLAAQYNYKSYEFRQLVSGTLVGSETAPRYLPVTALGDGTTTVQADVPASSARFFLTTGTTGGARTIRFSSGGGPPSDPAGVMRVYVVRVQ